MIPGRKPEACGFGGIADPVTADSKVARWTGRAARDTT